MPHILYYLTCLLTLHSNTSSSFLSIFYLLTRSPVRTQKSQGTTFSYSTTLSLPNQHSVYECPSHWSALPTTPMDRFNRQVVLLVFAVMQMQMPTVIKGFDIRGFLRQHPEFSTFDSLLGATGVDTEIGNRSSLTILAPTNAQMTPFLARFAGNLPTTEVSDVLRYHVLLEYMDWDRLQHLTGKGTLVTTLYQTTGRAPNNTGAVNLTATPDGQVRVGMVLAGATGYNATITGIVAKFPYTISIARISNMLYPYGFLSSSSPSQRPPPAINVTDVLVRAGGFYFLASLIEASGLDSILESAQSGAGITIFAPTDDAFSDLNPDTLQGLTAQKKAAVLKFHVLLSYYPLGSLQTIVNPMQPTLATQESGAGKFTLNITRFEGFVAVGSGIVVAPVTQTVFDQKPLAIFAVDKVLLPTEIFRSSPSPAPSPSVIDHPPKALPPSPRVINNPPKALPPSPSVINNPPKALPPSTNTKTPPHMPSPKCSNLPPSSPNPKPPAPSASESRSVAPPPSLELLPPNISSNPMVSTPSESPAPAPTVPPKTSSANSKSAVLSFLALAMAALLA